MNAIYNELDAYPAAWLRNLIAAGHVAPGVVDERSIVDLSADDVAGPGQRHFFAGIGVWSAALRDAGVPDDADVWTASCPCQPFSGAGKRRGTADERHLWPVLRGFVEECRPPVLLGEQVASRDGRAWFAAVRADLEALGYAVGAADLCAAGVGAPHIRQRLYFVAYADDARLEVIREQPARRELATAERSGETRRDCACWDRGCAHRAHGVPIGVGMRFADGGVADAESVQRDRDWLARNWRGQPANGGGSRWLAVSDTGRRRAEGQRGMGRTMGVGADPGMPPTSENTGVSRREFWSDCDWIPCSDGKSRPVEPGTFPLAHGVAGRVGRLRAYGNAIVRPQAAAFIRAALELEVTP